LRGRQQYCGTPGQQGARCPHRQVSLVSLVPGEKRERSGQRRDESESN